MWADAYRVKDITNYNSESMNDDNYHQNKGLRVLVKLMRSIYKYIINYFNWYMSFRNKATHTRLLRCI